MKEGPACVTEWRFGCSSRFTRVQQARGGKMYGREWGAAWAGVGRWGGVRSEGCEMRGVKCGEGGWDWSMAAAAAGVQCTRREDCG